MAALNTFPRLGAFSSACFSKPREPKGFVSEKEERRRSVDSPDAARYFKGLYCTQQATP
jgi:hypothetical protein